MNTPTPEDLATLSLMKMEMEHYGDIYRESSARYWEFYEVVYGEQPQEKRIKPSGGGRQ